MCVQRENLQPPVWSESEETEVEEEETPKVARNPRRQSRARPVEAATPCEPRPPSVAKADTSGRGKDKGARPWHPLTATYPDEDPTSKDRSLGLLCERCALPPPAPLVFPCTFLL